MKVSRTYKKWLLQLGLVLCTTMTVLGAFNYCIDPLWCFSHSHWFASLQKPCNERQQKINYLNFVNSKKYDAVIIGNSRTCMMNQNDLSGFRAYNYSVAALTLNEYPGQLENFKKTSGTPGTIFLALHFLNSDRLLKPPAEMPDFYLKNAQSPFYRLKMLFTKDSISYSLGNLLIDRDIRKNKSGGNIYFYDHSNVAVLMKPNPAMRLNSIKNEVAGLRKTYASGYQYRADLKETLTGLVQSNSGSRFIPFTTPVSKPYFCAMVLEGRLPEYERFLRETVDVFGQVWHFEYLNSVTQDYEKNFSDSHHSYPAVGTMIAHRMTGVEDVTTPPDFGMLLTSATIDQQLEKIRADSALCR